jgi:hypothetical protein
VPASGREGRGELHPERRACDLDHHHKGEEMKREKGKNSCLRNDKHSSKIG